MAEKIILCVDDEAPFDLEEVIEVTASTVK